MAEQRDSGIADDASDYEDFPEDPPRPARGEGISDDAEMYQDLVAEGTEDVLDLDSHWLYKAGEEVFGPVSAKSLVEMLYAGGLTAESKIAPEDGEFMALRRYGAFRTHLPKAAEHRAAAEAARRLEREAKAKVRTKRVGFFVVAALVGVAFFAGVFYVVQERRAEQLAKDKEAKLEQELSQMLAAVTIELPLIDLKAEEEEPPEANDPGKKGGRRKKTKRAAPLSGSTEKLSREEIMGGVSSAFAGIKRCIVQQMQRDSESVPERIVLSFSIGNDGAVKEVSFDDRFLRKSPMRSCVADKLAAVRFRAFKGEVRNIEYPITIGKH